MTTIDVNALKTDPYNYSNNLPIPKLVQLLKKLSLSYYTDKPVIPDNVYDIIKGVLEEKDPKNKFLTTVGYDISNDKQKVVLPYPLFSLDKLKTVDSWIKKYPGPYALSDKLDGISGLLYKNNKQIMLFTRGDSINGRDISHLLPYLLKDYDYDQLGDRCAIRGEIVISRKNYETVKDKYLDHRSCLAGLVNSKKDAIAKEADKEKLANLTDFVAYELIEPRHKQDTQFEMLEKYGLPVVTHKIKENIDHEILSKYLTKRRTASKYNIDGIVVGDCSKKYELSKDSNPSYAFAFKLVFGDQIVETVVRHVEWTTSKDSYIKPVVILEPVKINGITISKVTGNNAKYIVTNKIGPGTVLKIIRSGDVIPKIVEVVSGQVTKPSLPNIKYKWNDTKVDIIATEMTKSTKDDMTTKKIAYFFSAMKVSFIGEGIVRKLVGAGYNTVESILSANLKNLEKIDGLGSEVVKKIFESIRVAFEVADLPMLMAASGILGRSMGKTRIKVIVDAIPNIMNEKIDDTLKNKINALEGFSDITTNQFITGLPQFKIFFEMLSKIDTISVKHMLIVKKDDKKDDKTEIFKNMKFAFTGPRNKNIEEFVVANGGKIASTVSSTTNMLLCESTDESSSSKYVKALELNVKIMVYDDFMKQYM